MKNFFGSSSNQITLSSDISLEIQADYFSKETDSKSKFYEFLSEFEIKSSEELTENLWKLYQQDMSPLSSIKWSSVDHLLEKALQWLLLSQKDVEFKTKSAYCSRIKPEERSILLKNVWGLMKAYAAQGFCSGINLGIFTSIHLFIYSMLLYRLVKTFQTGNIDVGDLKSSFISSDQKGIESLVYLLAHLDGRWLKLILISPLIIGSISAVFSMLNARYFSIYKIVGNINQKLESSSWWRDGLYESLPGISNNSGLSLSGKLTKLERIIRWDGRFTIQERQDAFDAICKTAQRGTKTVRLHALECLAKIAHGIGIKDFIRLKDTGYSVDELKVSLLIKGKALKILESKEIEENNFSDLPQKIYRGYLLWWLFGIRSDLFRQQLPAFLFKTSKLFVEFYFLKLLVLSILQAIKCPDKQGFQLGFGYPAYADKLTISCYQQMIHQFRAVNLSDSVAQLVAQTKYFNLQDLTSLQLINKNLTGNEMIAIIKSAEIQGANFSEIDLYDYFSDEDMQSVSAYLNFSQVKKLKLGCVDSEYSGGEGLNDQGLQYLANVLPFLKQLTFLQLCFPNMGDIGMNSLAEKLSESNIEKFYLFNSNITDLAGVKLAEAFSNMFIQQIALTAPHLSDVTVQALQKVVQDNKFLTELWLEGNLITNKGAKLFADMIGNSSLHTIGLLSINITDEGVIALAHQLPNLPITTLILGSNSGEVGMITLMNQLNHTGLNTLELWYNTFTNKSMDVFMSILPFTKISYLLLNQNKLDVDTFAHLSVGIPNSYLDYLVVFNIEMKDFLTFLGPNLNRLTGIQLQSCSITDEDLIALIPFLPNSKIQELTLESNLIGDQSTLKLAEILTNTSINYLNLGNNKITNTGAQSLANIYIFSHMQYLYLIGNSISDNILYTVEDFSWRQYCQDQLCHANAAWDDKGNMNHQNNMDSSLENWQLLKKTKLKEIKHRVFNTRSVFQEKQESFVKANQKFSQKNILANTSFQAATLFNMLVATQQQTSGLALSWERSTQSPESITTIGVLLGFVSLSIAVVSLINKKKEAIQTIFQASSQFIRFFFLKKQSSFESSHTSFTNNGNSMKPM